MTSEGKAFKHQQNKDTIGSLLGVRHWVDDIVEFVSYVSIACKFFCVSFVFRQASWCRCPLSIDKHVCMCIFIPMYVSVHVMRGHAHWITDFR